MSQVLEKAFLGTGCSLQQARRSRRYAQLLDQERCLEAQVAHDEAARAALFAGPLAVTVALNKRPIDRAPSAIAKLPPRARSIEQRAMFRLLGERIAAEAAKRLPAHIRRLAKRWHELEEFEQRALLIAFSAWLKTSEGDKPKTIEEDRANQPDERVLPAAYRPGRKGHPQPNCLGKAQLIAGFVHLARAEAFGCVPILMYDMARISVHRDICHETLKALVAMPGYNRKWAKRLRSAIAEEDKKLNQPSWQHAAVLIKLANGRWIMVDPNFRGVQELPEQRQLRSQLALLKRFAAVQPGVALLDGPRDLNGCSRKLRHKLKRNIEPARFVAELSLSKRLDLDRAVSAISQSPHFKAICESMRLTAFDRRKRGREGSVRWWLRWQITAFQAKGLRGSRTADGALKLVLQDVVDRLLETAIFAFDVVRYLESAMRLHPQREYQELGHFLATATVAHLAVNANRSAETEEVLVTENAGQFRLYHRMLELFNGGDSQGAWDAARALRSLPFRLGSVNRLLPKLQA